VVKLTNPVIVPELLGGEGRGGEGGEFSLLPLMNEVLRNLLVDRV